MKKISRLLIAATVLTAIGLSGCDINPSDIPLPPEPEPVQEENGADLIKKMSIAGNDVASLFIGTADEASSARAARVARVASRAARDADGYEYEVEELTQDTKDPVLYKVNFDGTIEGVEYFDEEGKKIEKKITPSLIHNINDDFVLIQFQYAVDKYYTETYSYLTRKSDGAAYSLSKIGNPVTQTNYANTPMTQVVEDDLYTIVNNRTLQKIDLNGIESLRAERLSESIDRVMCFTVDDNKNYIYMSDENHDGKDELGLNKYENSSYSAYVVVNVQGDEPVYTVFNNNEICGFWTGLDGVIYTASGKLVYNETTGDPEYAINKIVFGADGKAQLEKICMQKEWLPFHYTTLLRMDSAITLFKVNGYILEADNASGTPRQVNLDVPITSVRGIQSYGNYYFMHCLIRVRDGIDGEDQGGEVENAFLMVNSKTDVCTNLLPGGKYEVQSFSVGEESITFTAEDLDEGDIVIATVEPGQEPKILSRTALTITYLQRIN